MAAAPALLHDESGGHEEPEMVLSNTNLTKLASAGAVLLLWCVLLVGGLAQLVH